MWYTHKEISITDRRIIVSHTLSGNTEPYQCDVIYNSSVTCTKQEWYVRVNVRIRHRQFVSKAEPQVANSTCLHKLNASTIPTQTPTPRKDVLQNNMVGCTIYSALELVDGYYQLLMRASDIPLTAVSVPSGMLWEWLVMPQGLSNAPDRINRLVTQLFRTSGRRTDLL